VVKEDAKLIREGLCVVKVVKMGTEQKKGSGIPPSPPYLAPVSLPVWMPMKIAGKGTPKR
jgi:hypothetical protein